MAQDQQVQRLPPTLTALPLDLHCYITQFLTNTDKCRLSRTCQAFHRFLRITPPLCVRVVLNIYYDAHQLVMGDSGQVFYIYQSFPGGTVRLSDHAVDVAECSADEWIINDMCDSLPEARCVIGFLKIKFIREGFFNNPAEPWNQTPLLQQFANELSRKPLKIGCMSIENVERTFLPGVESLLSIITPTPNIAINLQMTQLEYYREIWNLTYCHYFQDAMEVNLFNLIVPVSFVANVLCHKVKFLATIEEVDSIRQLEIIVQTCCNSAHFQSAMVHFHRPQHMSLLEIHRIERADGATLQIILDSTSLAINVL